MRLLAAIVLLLALTAPAFAQQAGAPVIETEIDKTETIPGQTLNLSVTVLVPTYMPKPPVSWNTRAGTPNSTAIFSWFRSHNRRRRGR